MNLCFSGLTSCGKTSHANHFGKQNKMSVVSASALLVEMWRETWLHTIEIGDGKWHPWIRSFGDFNRNRLDDQSVDKLVDEHIADTILKRTRVIVESLTAPFLLEKIGKKSEEGFLRIYFHASHKNRVSRAFRSSPTLSMGELDLWVFHKDGTSRAIIQSLWWTDILNLEEQFSYNDVVLNTDVTDNGDPNDELNVRMWKNITRQAIGSIVRFLEDWAVSTLDPLRDIDMKHPKFLHKLPDRVCEIIR